jgi:ferredoxin
MKLQGKQVLVCNCEGTMSLDGGALAKACGVDKLTLNSHLCRAQLANFQNALSDSDPVLVACTQEAPLFSETAAQGAPEAALSFTNIRERAGWSDEAGQATPKIAALLAEAALDVPLTPAVTMESGGVVLVYGRDDVAVDAAKQLARRVDATCLLKAPDEVLPPRLMDVPVFRGRITATRGHLGAFEINVDDYAPLTPSSRASLAFEFGRDGAASQCDVILDLTGDAPLFSAPEKRDGYFNPDPGNPALVQKALFDIADMVGEFEKPRYVNYDAEICAHARSGITGCTRCLDLCPTGAITPDGDHVAIDPYVCAGCGTCASVCPTGAATYDLPSGDFLFERLRTLLGAYRAGGGADPVLLIHDTRHGDEMISLIARTGRGLPANVLPFAVNEVTQVGLDVLLAALAYGAGLVRILTGPGNEGEMEGLAGQIGLVEAALSGLGYGSGRAGVIDAIDPEIVESALYDLPTLAPAEAASFLTMGGKRTRISLALQHLHESAPEPVDILPLPAGAPFGSVVVDSDGCTLCLSCVGACPTGAMRDDPDKPFLGFMESACVQCGLCRVTCPESVIALEPRFNFTEEARRPVLRKEEEPFECVRCGKPFGVKSSVERMVAKLVDHPMYTEKGSVDRIKMCEDCRVIVQFEVTDNPFAVGTRPVTRTTDDYLTGAVPDEDDED